MSLLLTLNIFRAFSSVSIVDLEQVNVRWVRKQLRFFLMRFTQYNGVQPLEPIKLRRD